MDVFFAAEEFDREVDRRCRNVPFAGRSILVLCVEDLAVFKATFDVLLRTRQDSGLRNAVHHGLQRLRCAEKCGTLEGHDDLRVGTLGELGQRVELQDRDQ